MAHGSTAQTPIGFDAAPNSDVAITLATGGSAWQVANTDALAVTDGDPKEARWPFGIVSAAPAIEAHANCPVIRTTDRGGNIRGSHMMLCVAWLAASATTLTGVPRVMVLADCSGDSPGSADLTPAGANPEWPSFRSITQGGRGSWVHLPDVDGDEVLPLNGTRPIYDTDESTWHLYLGQPVDLAIRGARRIVVPVVTAGALSGPGTAIVLHRFWS